MLTVSNIQTYYGDSHILQGLSLEVGAGEVVCLVGRNGAGKTTTIRSICGWTQPREGKVLFRGRDITRMAAHAIVGLGMGIVPQGRRIFANLTVRENLQIAQRPGPWHLDRVYELFPVLGKRQHQRGGSLSGGEQSMLAIARALMGNPSFLLMDEPSEGLAPVIVQNIASFIRELKGEGLGILLVEQNLPLALGTADRLLVINKGRVVHASTPERIVEEQQVMHQYLGV